jgi:Protein of unknown function (DUF2817)
MAFSSACSMRHSLNHVAYGIPATCLMRHNVGMISIPSAFSPSYAKARVKFLEAAASAGLAITSYAHPLPGKDGEDLAMDVALDGSPDAKALLIVSSACHGVEGYCGSGVQVFALHDQEWRDKAKAAGVAVLYIHALNPYGFSHLRRVTHENVDLNRNFQDFSKPLPASSTNPGYASLHDLLLPQEWPPTPENIAACADWMSARSVKGSKNPDEASGLRAFQQAVSQGQYSHADGLFFGGNAPTWSNLTLRKVLKQYAQRCDQFAWIDIHTGLGPRGLGERIFACKDDAAAYERASRWWGNKGNPSGETPVTSIYNGSSTSALLTGLIWQSVYQEAPQAEYTAIAMEYGTVPVQDTLNALRADHWLAKHPEAPAEQAKHIKQQLLDTFYVDTDEWKGQIVSQARQSMFQAVDGLSA